ALWKQKLPQPRPASFARAWWEKEAAGDTRPLLIEWTPDPGLKEADFYPLTSTNSTVRTATEMVRTAGSQVRLRKEVEKGNSGWSTEIAGLLIERGDGDKLLGAYQVRLPVAGAGLVATSGSSAGAPTAPAVGGIEKKPLAAWLGLA